MFMGCNEHKNIITKPKIVPIVHTLIFKVAFIFFALAVSASTLHCTYKNHIGISLNNCLDTLFKQHVVGTHTREDKITNGLDSQM